MALILLENNGKGLEPWKREMWKAAVSWDTLRIFSTINIHIYTFWQGPVPPPQSLPSVDDQINAKKTKRMSPVTESYE